MPAQRQSASMPHSGIATFCKAPYVFDPAEMEGDVAILGVPFDNTASMRPGCRQAPRALRDASARFGWLGEPAGSRGFFDINKNETFMKGVRILDAGDVDVSLDHAVTRERTTAHARSILDRGLLLASIGGDHSVTFPLVAAFEKFAPLTIVLLDAHLDYRDLSMNMKFTNNSPFRRAHELPFIKRIITMGVRGIKSTDREYREELEHGNLVFPMDRVYADGVGAIVKEIGGLGNYYVSLDIDGLDPSIAPGTESPEADGLSYRRAKEFLRGIAKNGKLVGADVVEVNPYLDHAELTQHMAVQLLLETIATGFPSAKTPHK